MTPSTDPASARPSSIRSDGARVRIHPTDVRGPFRTKRLWLSVILMALFLGAPWVTVDGVPMILIDIQHGKFVFFWTTFWAHNAPMLLFVAAIFILTVSWVTAVFGRAWCGWACPQTVFTEWVFRRIERAIEGDAVARRRADAGGWTTQRLSAKALKWTAFLGCAIVLSHSFLAYFVGKDGVLAMMSRPPAENPGTFFAMLVMTAFVLFDFGWFREQFCSLICPYGRFQSALLDEQSWQISYDSGRKDCIDCDRCVKVCPAGIDIRAGLQPECIACTACIDACTPVMAKLRKPTGLIRYTPGENFSARLSIRTAILRPRPMILLAVILVLATTLTVVLARRPAIDALLVRAAGDPYSLLDENGQARVLNRFRLDLQNQSGDTREISLDWSDRAVAMSVTAPGLPAVLAPGERRRFDVFVRFSKESLTEGHTVGALRLSIRALATNPELQYQPLEVRLVGPFR